MGKNQQHKAAQQARHAGAGADEPPPTDQVFTELTPNSGSPIYDDL